MYYMSAVEETIGNYYTDVDALMYKLKFFSSNSQANLQVLSKIFWYSIASTTSS